MDIEKKILIMCPLCKAVEDGSGWFKREENQKLYDELLKQSNGNLLHDYCPVCRWKTEEEIYKTK